MTVLELKNKLAELPTDYDNFLVVLSKDAEGNGFRQMSPEFSFGTNDLWGTSEYFYDLSERDLISYCEEDYDDFEEFVQAFSNVPKVEPCIVLWPN